MGWVRISDDFYDNPKFQQVTAAAVGMWVAAMSYANRNLTDGFISKRALSSLVNLEGLAYVGPMSGDDARPEYLQGELVDSGILHGPGHGCPHCPDVPDGWFVIHDYLQFQPSRDEVEERRAEVARKRSEAGRKGAEARWGNGKNGKTMAKGIATEWQTDGPNPNPNRQTTYVNRSSNVLNRARDDDDQFKVKCESFGLADLLPRLQSLIPDAGFFELYYLWSAIQQDAKGPIKSPAAYVGAVLKDSPERVQKIVFEGAA